MNASKLLIASGIVLLCFSAYSYYQRLTPKRLEFIGYRNEQSARNLDTNAVGIIINKINLSLPLYEASIKNGVWEASTLGVSHLSTTPTPGNPGNSVLYGHNWPNLLGGLVNIQPGDIITIYFDNGGLEDFRVQLTQEVMSSQVSVLDQTDEPRITLYTCSGFLDSKRFVVIASPVSSLGLAPSSKQ